MNKLPSQILKESLMPLDYSTAVAKAMKYGVVGKLGWILKHEFAFFSNFYLMQTFR